MTAVRPAVRFAIAWLAGTALTGTFLHGFGEDLPLIVRQLGDWIPTAVAYGATVVVSLQLLGIARLAGMIEILGLCVGLFPPVFGLLPPHRFVWPMTLKILVAQVSVLACAASLVWGVHAVVRRLRGR